MIACVSSASGQYAHTVNTLKYANRAKEIKTHVRRNEMSVQAHIAEYQRMIDALREENKELRGEIKHLAKVRTEAQAPALPAGPRALQKRRARRPASGRSPLERMSLTLHLFHCAGSGQHEPRAPGGPQTGAVAAPVGQGADEGHRLQHKASGGPEVAARWTRLARRSRGGWSLLVLAGTGRPSSRHCSRFRTFVSAASRRSMRSMPSWRQRQSTAHRPGPSPYALPLLTVPFHRGVRVGTAALPLRPEVGRLLVFLALTGASLGVTPFQTAICCPATAGSGSRPSARRSSGALPRASEPGGGYTGRSASWSSPWRLWRSSSAPCPRRTRGERGSAAGSMHACVLACPASDPAIDP